MATSPFGPLILPNVTPSLFRPGRLAQLVKGRVIGGLVACCGIRIPPRCVNGGPRRVHKGPDGSRGVQKGPDGSIGVSRVVSRSFVSGYEGYEGH